MAQISEIDEGALALWVAERPPEIQEMVRRCPPGRLYRNTATGERVIIMAYAENGTVRVAVPALFNLIAFERGVFGVPIDNLIECELPAPDEVTGAILTESEVSSAVKSASTPEGRRAAVARALQVKVGRRGSLAQCPQCSRISPVTKGWRELRCACGATSPLPVAP